MTPPADRVTELEARVRRLEAALLVARLWLLQAAAPGNTMKPDPALLAEIDAVLGEST